MKRGTCARFDFLVVGGGAVGLCVADALAQKGSTVVVERHKRLGEELSTRNSGVIHAGLYYPPGSLKAKHCVRGNRMLYAWCAKHRVEHARTSKLIVARTENETQWLETCLERAAACGVNDLKLNTQAQLARQEPDLLGVAALRSPSSGIVNAAELVRSLAHSCRSRGADFALETEVLHFEREPHGWYMSVRGPQGEESVRANVVVNASGLSGARIARLMGRAQTPDYRLVKGNYFRLCARVPKPQTPLVYPVPSADGLGIHLTRELGGNWIAGPDTEAVAEPDFSVGEGRGRAFADDLCRMLRGVSEADLQPHFASVRPKRGTPGGFDDFEIEIEPQHAVVHLLGIESPGLTAALSIAATVAEAW